jgi:hypothetical protein
MIFYILGFIQGPYTVFKYRDNIWDSAEIAVPSERVMASLIDVLVSGNDVLTSSSDVLLMSTKVVSLLFRSPYVERNNQF